MTTLRQCSINFHIIFKGNNFSIYIQAPFHVAQNLQILPQGPDHLFHFKVRQISHWAIPKSDETTSKPNCKCLYFYHRVGSESSPECILALYYFCGGMISQCHSHCLWNDSNSYDVVQKWGPLKYNCSIVFELQITPMFYLDFHRGTVPHKFYVWAVIPKTCAGMPQIHALL